MNLWVCVSEQLLQPGKVIEWPFVLTTRINQCRVIHTMLSTNCEKKQSKICEGRNPSLIAVPLIVLVGMMPPAGPP